ncbi:MAG TPA: hypothetical protein VFL49_02365 [Pseudolabrys sp.]|nr:hypothetical protein [Pseudolabrys sp.]
MLKSDTGLVIALAAVLAVASPPALAKGQKSSTPKHTVKGEHIKEGTITVRKKSKSKPAISEIKVTKPVDKSSP